MTVGVLFLAAGVGAVAALFALLLRVEYETRTRSGGE